MDGIRQYVLSIIAASVVCSIVRRLIGSKPQIKMITDVVCGLFLAITVLSPWVDWRMPDMMEFYDSFSASAQLITEDGRKSASEDMAAIIKNETQAYILEKAQSLNLDVDVEVNLDSQSNFPESVVISGQVSPYGKTVLSQYITQTLDIPEELQQWV